MSEDKEVCVTVTPEDMEFRARAKAAGLPDVLISMYDSALRRLVADEREACAKVCDVTPPYPFRPSIEAAHAIRARSKE